MAFIGTTGRGCDLPATSSPTNTAAPAANVTMGPRRIARVPASAFELRRDHRSQPERFDCPFERRVSVLARSLEVRGRIVEMISDLGE
jgi:hypothetical protein